MFRDGFFVIFGIMKRMILTIAAALLMAGSVMAQPCCTGNCTDFHHIAFRGDLHRSFARMAEQKKATVAFLGGSITEMKGWHEMVEEDLRRRFPDTEFHFIEAGIGSLGSTPHAFRMEADVLEKGTPDLMFVEAAVNDHTNRFGPVEQVRGMEGIVRHALKVNPEMDIVMLHFIYDPFLPMLAEGVVPDVILNHDRVANHYRLTSIDLASEISARMADGQLTWEEFGGTHPAPLGHRYYMGAIAKVFDANMPCQAAAASGASAEVARVLPEPIDTLCYENGQYVPLENATALKGFSLVPSWEPSVGASLRNGFHGVPMLSADRAGASFRLKFDGRAIGLFMVAGPEAGIMEYRVDKGDWKRIDPFTEWSRGLYIPWVYMLETELAPGTHELQLKIVDGGITTLGDGSTVRRTSCHIRNFVVNR